MRVSISLFTSFDLQWKLKSNKLDSNQNLSSSNPKSSLIYGAAKIIFFKTYLLLRFSHPKNACILAFYFYFYLVEWSLDTFSFKTSLVIIFEVELRNLCSLLRCSSLVQWNASKFSCILFDAASLIVSTLFRLFINLYILC